MGGELGNWLVIGRIAGVFGVRGELKVEPLTDFPERFAGLARIYLAGREYAVEQSRPHKSQVLMKLAGIDTPEAASALAGRDIEIPRSEAVKLPEGHYWLDELIGYTVSTPDGRSLGMVTDVLRTGSNDVYVVGQGRQEVLIPGTRDAVRTLDLATRRIVIEPWVVAPEIS